MKAITFIYNEQGLVYPVLKFVCPGCRLLLETSGLHILPVNTVEKQPAWEWNGSTTKPTLLPSILTKTHNGICHSFLTDGVFHFLEDSEHALAGQEVPMVDLPDWAQRNI